MLVRANQEDEDAAPCETVRCGRRTREDPEWNEERDPEVDVAPPIGATFDALSFRMATPIVTFWIMNGRDRV